MYGRQIANDFIVSARTRFASADQGVRWCNDENRGTISRISGEPPKILIA